MDCRPLTYLVHSCPSSPTLAVAMQRDTCRQPVPIGSVIRYSALRNGRPVFEKIGYVFFCLYRTCKQSFLSPQSDGDQHRPIGVSCTPSSHHPSARYSPPVLFPRLLKVATRLRCHTWGTGTTSQTLSSNTSSPRPPSSVITAGCPTSH